MDTHELEWLRRVRDLSQQLGSETDLASLTPRILTAALELTGAQRAMLVAVQAPDPGGHAKIRVLASEGFHREGLDGAGGAVPRAACERVLNEGRGLTTSRSEDLQVLSAMTSVAELGARSLAAVPLRLRGETQGVLYLDHLEREGLFDERDLPTLQTLATQAALSLELLGQAPPPEPSSGESQYLVGDSPPLQALRDELQRAGRCREPVLVCGEAGTELGWVARDLHARGSDRLARFRLVSAAAPDVAQQLLGVSTDDAGWLATPTTVAISEAESLPAELQLALARALAEGRYTPPNSARTHAIAARLVVMTHADLFEKVQLGEFRPELFYRLDVLRLVVPPLRQRSEDLPAVCAAVADRLQLRPLAFTPDAMERMQSYAWPGNMLELEGELKRLAQGSPRPVEPADLSERIRTGRGVVASTASFAGKTLSEIEESLVREAMERCGGVKARAARQLGVPRSTLYHLLERYGIK